MRFRITALVLCIVSVTGCHTDSPSNLKSPDSQIRCDAFHNLFGDLAGPGEKQTRKGLYGKTTKEIHALLGDPTSVATLEHKGNRWLQISYRFEVCPTKGGRDAWEKGWRYSPTVVFRNGISVPPSRLDEELELHKYSIPPQHLKFKEGGRFP